MPNVEDINYHNDRRVRAAEEREDRESRLGFDESKMTLTLSVEFEDDETGEEVEEVVSFPARYEVCGTCDGKGRHVNPSIDSHGITHDEWSEWGDDEREAYLSGGYDVPCYGCQGRRVIPVIDEERIKLQGNAELLKKMELVYEREKDDAEYRAICHAERMMGA